MLRKIAKQAKFMVGQRFGHSPVPDQPELEPEAREYFLSRIINCRLYLEYGMGGSTIIAARLGKRFVSTESDPFYLRDVSRKIGTSNGTLIYANIGITKEWGIPLFKNPTPRRLLRWKRYPKAPWSFLKNEKPDLILVDGRFRISSALTSIYRMNGYDFELLVDDYFHRPEYAVITDFSNLSHSVGRMAVFTPKKFSELSILKAIEKHSSDYM